MRYLIIVLLAAVLSGCVDYSAKQETPELDVQAYTVLGLDPEEVSDSLNELSSDKMPIRASVAGPAYVLVVAPAHVHQRLPVILEELGAQRDLQVRRVGITVWHLQALPAEAFEVSEDVPEQVGSRIIETLRARGIAPHSIARLDETYVSTTASTLLHVIDIVGRTFSLNDVFVVSRGESIELVGSLSQQPTRPSVQFSVSGIPGDSIILSQRLGEREDQGREYFVIQFSE